MNKSQTPRSSAIWHANLFGQFKVANQRETHTRFESKRAIALLAYLIIFPKGQSREALADRLWPDADLTTARNRLKQTLSSLRRLLEPPGIEKESVLIASRASIALQPGSISSDYIEFIEALQQKNNHHILHFANEEFLPGIYDEWLDDIRLWIESNSVENKFVPQFTAPPYLAIETTPLKSSKNVHIPKKVTNFFGRDSETQSVLERLNNYRLVTITGIGGTGKTRLSLNVAENADFANITFVSLAEVDDPTQLLPTILNALGSSISNKLTPLETLAQLIKGDEHLIILDNLEQLAGPKTAQVLNSFLETCSSIRILASSRIPLDNDGEADFPLYPLPVPSNEQSLAEIAESPSARLFIDRARKSRADFQITENNRQHLVALFQKLGGMPLAIELCAAWSHVLTPSQMLAKLESDDSLLISKRVDIPQRQRSLIDAFTTTTSLLSQKQLDLLKKLSTFRGGWSIELLNAVSPHDDHLETLSELSRAALIRSNSERSSIRFSMLESLRQFADGLPDEKNLKYTTQESLFECFIDLAEKTYFCQPDDQFYVQNELEWSTFWLLEWDNLRASISFALSQNRFDEIAQLLFNIEWIWRMFNRESEATSWLRQIEDNSQASHYARIQAKILICYHGINKGYEKLIEILPESENVGDQLRAFHFFAIANLLSYYRKWDQIEQYAEQAIQIALRVNEYRIAGKSHHTIGISYQLRGFSDKSPFHFDKAEDYVRKANRIHDLLSILYDRAFRAGEIGENQTAEHLFKEIIDQHHLTGDRRLISKSHNLLGTTLHQDRKWAEGNNHLVKSIEIYGSIQDYQGLLYPLWNLGLALCSLGQFMIGVPLLASSINIWENILGLELSPEELLQVENAYAFAEQSIGKELRLTLERKGKSMTIAEVTGFSIAALKNGLLEFEDGVQAKKL